jgi:hypothetical protein
MFHYLRGARLVFAGMMVGDECVENLIEKSRRQLAVIVVVAVRPPAQVVARPEEFVTFGDDNPRAIIVEAEMSLDRQRNLDRRGRIGRRAVVIGSTVTTIASSASRSAARTMTLGRSF